MLISRQTPS